MKHLFIIACCLVASVVIAQTHTISGYVIDAVDGETVISAKVKDKKTGKATLTNVYGFFSLTLPEDSVHLSVSSIGYSPISQSFYLNEDKELELALPKSNTMLQKVVIKADKDFVKEEVHSTQMSEIRLTSEEIAIIPTIGGESDLIKVAQLMPGISRGGEGGTGMYVRGGTDDQNLVLLDEAVVYNLGHLFGFFSVFNSDAIKDIKIVKGGFPAEYGGRLSSVMDVRMKEGSFTKYSAKGGIGLLSSRLSVDGPIIKDKMSFAISGRRTYIDQVMKVVGITLPYYFYDLNGKLTYKVSDRDKLYFSNYLGDDVSEIAENVDDEDATGELDFGFRLGNFTSTLRWNHAYENDKLFSNITLLQTRFKYDIQGSFLDNSLLIKSQIQDFGLKGDWDYDISPDNKVKFGAFIVNHRFRPNIVNTSGDVSDFLADNTGGLLATQEVSVYANNDRKLNEDWSINYGLRISSSNVEGAFYAGLEPRFSAKYTLSDSSSLKVSYTRMKQYMHRVSSSSVALPTDLWYPVTASIAPQRANQIAAGYFHGFPKWGVNISVEGYYKHMENLIEYKEGARLLLNDNFEDELLSGKGDSYGAEFLIRKKEGRFTGWVGYTLSWATRQFDGLNGGKRYFAKYDRRHDISTVVMLELSKRVSFSAVWVFSTGNRFTGQIGQYLMPNSSSTGVDVIPIYTERNGVVMSPSHRLDVNFVIKRKPEKKWEGEWHIGAYNFYNRASPYRINIQAVNAGYEYRQIGLFGFIPSIAYNFEF